MKKITTTVTATVFGATLVELSFAGAASATERHHVRRSAEQSTLSSASDPRNAFDYFGDRNVQQQERAAAYGVPAGYVYGGTISAPAGR